MNRIDRLFAILLRLQNRSLVRAEDLARAFEVTPRTIYRDMAALTEMGVPLLSLPGEGYQLMEGYYLPPLIFSPSEASALVLGARMLALQAVGQTIRDAESAVTKIVHSLPGATREQVERLSEIIHFFVPNERFNLDDPQLVDLQQAIIGQHVVFMRYHSQSGDEVTAREVEPRALTYSGGVWYLSGYCRLRQAERGFRLDRIEAFTILPDTFKPRSLAEEPAAIVEVRVRFSAAVLRWVGERQHYGFQYQEVDPDTGDSVMVYHLHRTTEIMPWLLAWGSSANVLAPEALRQQIRREALKLVEILT